MDKSLLMRRSWELMEAMADGSTIAEATRKYYKRRSLAVPINDAFFDAPINDVVYDLRASNALTRSGIVTIGDFVEFTNRPNWRKAKNGLGKTSTIRVFEALLNFAWDKLNADERAEFLVNFVIDNEASYREV